MQCLVLEKAITFKEKVQELIQVSIDDNIDYLTKSDGILLNGKIYLNGEVKIKNEVIEFLDTLDVDIYAPFDQLVDKKALQFKIEDFEYKINDNKVTFLLKVAIEGWSDMKSTFSAKKPAAKKEAKKGHVETVVDCKVKLSGDIELNKDLDVDDLEKKLEQESTELIDPSLCTEKDKLEMKEDNIDITPLKKALNRDDIDSIDAISNINKVVKNELIDELNKASNIDISVKQDLNVLINKMDQDIIVVDNDKTLKEFDINEKKLEEALLELLEAKHPIKIIEEKPIKVESKKVVKPKDEGGFDYFTLFRNNKKSNTVFWRYRVVLKDETYTSISKEIKISEKKLMDLNDNKILECGNLIKIPL